MAHTIELHSARDLGAAVRGLRPDAEAAGIVSTDAWCRDQMQALGISRDEGVGPETLDQISDRVDGLVTVTTEARS